MRADAKKGRPVRRLLALQLCLLALLLCGCRVRTTAVDPSQAGPAAHTVEAGGNGQDGREEEIPAAEDPSVQPDTAEAGAEPDRTVERRDADRREYDENAAVEITAGTGRTLHAEGEGQGTAQDAEQAYATVAKIDPGAEETATQKTAAEHADRMGVAEDAEEADSAMVYWQVLLEDRLGTLYECKRLNAYFEMPADCLTVHRSSQEHTLLIGAGVYDVSARLLEQNLTVDDGWIGRKDPQLIVKVVGRDVLGSGVADTAAALAVRTGLLARPGWTSIDAVRGGRILLISEELFEAPHLRLAAMLMIAKEAYPSLFADVDPDEALRQLAEEATGSAPAGVYRLSGQEDQ